VSALLFCLQVTIANLAGQTAKNTSTANPFGFHMGQKKPTIGKIVKEVAPYTFLLDSVPKPHPDLEIYRVTVTPKTGLCAVRGLSPEVATDEDGTQLQLRFERMTSALERAYGTPELLGRKFAMWSAKKLPPNSTLSRITVSTASHSPHSGYIAVQYYFNNRDQCEAEIAATTR
jgi:hypothetical protein